MDHSSRMADGELLLPIDPGTVARATACNPEELRFIRKIKIMNQRNKYLGTIHSTTKRQRTKGKQQLV